MAIFKPHELPDASNESRWLIEPYLPREGIVLLYGKKGVGKSPLTWSWAEAIASGQPWLGHTVNESGAVLYVELDTPRLVVSARMKQAMFSDNIDIVFPPGSIADTKGWERFLAEIQGLKPKLVVVNTLRKAHRGKDTDSNVPEQIYSNFRTQWPNACLCFVHHEKKTPASYDQVFTEGEEFSGSLAWANDAQIVLRIHRRSGRAPAEGYVTYLQMTGNQLAPLAGQLSFYLKNGLIGAQVGKVLSA